MNLTCILSNLKLYINPFTLANIGKEYVGLLLKSGKKASARGLPLTLDRLMRSCKVYSSAPTCSSILPRSNQYTPGVLAASMVSAWSQLRKQRAMKSSCPGELPVGLSTHQSRGPRSLSAAHRLPGVEPPRTCTLPVPRRLPAIGPACSEVELPSR
jgi:hypothetical protein